MIKREKRKYRLHHEIVIRDSSFGFWLNLKPFLPEGCNSMQYYVVKEGKICHKKILLPHQLYLEDLMEDTENMKYPAYFEPHFPKFDSIGLMEDLKDE